MKTKSLVIVALALVVGGTCPSDVNNDGTVGINDFLQLLGDWGPCPSATVVDMTTSAGSAGGIFDQRLWRVWSDGTVQERTKKGQWGPWIDLVPPPPPPSAHPVAITFNAAGIGTSNLWVEWSNGLTQFSYNFVDFPEWSSWEALP